MKKIIQIIRKIRKYDKKATNPFLNKNHYNPFESLHEQTYIWVENKKEPL